MLSPTMIISATDDFRFDWPNPGDAQQVWLWDQMHNPRPLPPMAAGVMASVMTRVMGGRRIVVNGYLYNSFGGPAAMSGPPPALGGGPSGFGSAPPDAMALWENDHLPRIREIVERIKSHDYEAMSAARLAGMLDGIFQEAGDAFALTFGALMSFGMSTNLLVDFCEGELGPEGAVRATTMIQGYENESAASGAGLGRLTEVASALPEVAAALKEGRFQGLENLPGGDAFLVELRAYLDEYGWRAVTWGEIHVPTWAEEPDIPLKLIGRYLADPEHSPATALKRAVQQREATIAETEARLAPDKLEHFRGLLRAAQVHVPISEGRAMWQLIIAGVLRIPLLELGRKLVASGRLAQPGDVFFVSQQEVIDLAEGRPLLGVQALVETRRADLRRWGRLIPPRYLGVAPPSGMLGMMYRFFGYGVEQSADSSVVNGIAASKGVVRAVARVVMDLSEADKLGSGEVLVCPSTAPPWTPLFAIAGAVVTDSGGVLSHSAIAAREYGIPAVVGTTVSTHKIPDGAIVTVDGGQGIVRIED